MIKITKSITFNLNNGEDDLSLPDLMRNGYTRPDIIQLFEKLQSLGFGEYREGSKGRNQFHRFVKNETCPTEFVLHIEQQPRGRPRAMAAVQTENVKRDPTEVELDEVSQEINSGDIVIYDVVETPTETSMANTTPTTTISDSPEHEMDDELAQAVDCSIAASVAEDPEGPTDEIVEAVELQPINDGPKEDDEELLAAVDVNTVENAVMNEELPGAVDETVLEADLREAKVVDDLGAVASSLVVVPQAPKPQVQPSSVEGENIGADIASA